MVFYQLLASALLATMATAGHQGGAEGFGSQYNGASNSYGTPTGGFGSGYDGHGGSGDFNEEPKSYQFGYAVKDYASGNDYNRKESSDGNTVQGEYRVLLPDGRTQIVTYIADWQNGFRSNVRYEGEAHYPEPVNSGYGTGASQSGGGNYGQGNSGSSGHGQGGSGFPGHGQGSSGFSNHGQASSGFSNHGQASSGFSGHGQASSGFSGHGQASSGFSGSGQLGSSFSGHGGSNFGSSHSGGFESQSGSLGVSSTYGPPSYHK
uniref:Pro-resilin n=1 Tax=Timema shepardi TaxID=629360 RepID=A0A7R9AWW5_TIMSH|nr:unnamed protein product [Timema shepardi]